METLSHDRTLTLYLGIDVHKKEWSVSNFYRCRPPQEFQPTSFPTGSGEQKDPVMLTRYNELKQRLTEKRAIVVIARKLISRIYSVLKNQTAYQVGYVN